MALFEQQSETPPPPEKNWFNKLFHQWKRNCYFKPCYSVSCERFFVYSLFIGLMVTFRISWWEGRILRKVGVYCFKDSGEAHLPSRPQEVTHPQTFQWVFLTRRPEQLIISLQSVHFSLSFSPLISISLVSQLFPPVPPSPLTHPTKSLSITQNPFSSWNWVFSFYAFVLWNPNTPLSNCCLTVVRGEGDLFSTPGCDCEWVCVVQEFTGDLTLKLERNEELPTSSNLKAPIS